jgi:TDG/mug DNA glycosylase family protein
MGDRRVSEVTGFPAVAGDGARVLILGSMPGVASLEKNQYYALPQNSFWRIMGDLFGAGIDLPYAERLRMLVRHGIVLWDVLETCQRPGSLDSSIKLATARPNDFQFLFLEHATIRRVFFNGRKAADIFSKKVLPTLDSEFGEKVYQTLPSTSPAHASMTYAQKLKSWSAIAQALTNDRLDESQLLRDARG